MTEWRRLASPYRAYEVSDDGRLRRGGRELAGTVDRYGYRTVALYYAGIPKHAKFHRLVCGAFHGPAPSPQHEACHADGDKLNNVAENLRWGTKADNAADSIRQGRFYHRSARPGEEHHSAKLSAAEVAELRRLGGSVSQRALARRFGISQTQVCHILQGKMWAEGNRPDPSSPGGQIK